MLKMVDGTGIIGVDMICPLGVSTPQPPNYDRVELEGSGMLVLPNSLDAPLERLELFGNSVQLSTTGAQLLDRSIITTVGAGVSYYAIAVGGGKYTLSTKHLDTDQCDLFFFDGKVESGASSRVNGVNSKQSRTVESVDGYVTIGIRKGTKSENPLDFETMLNFGDKALLYEPYTGGKPSPSQEYQQEIKNVGKWNEGTQKYEVDVKVTGKNRFNREKAKDVSNWTPCAFNANFAEIAVYVGTGSTVTASNNVKIDNPVYYYGVALKSSEDIKYSICYPGYPSSKDTHTFTATEDYIYVRCNKTSLNEVIGVCGGLQIEIGASRTDFESYKEQTLTITSDRPITKWDRLVEQGGQIGWLYKHKIIEDFSTLVKDTEPIYGNNGGKFFSVSLQNASLNYDRSKIYSEVGMVGKDSEIYYTPKPLVATTIIYVSDTDTIMTAKEHMHYKVVYETVDSEFIPLSQDQQDAIRALKTYYPTTVITADGGELYPDIKVTYRKEK